MQKVAIIAHTADRTAMLQELLASASVTRCLEGWKVVLIAQGYTEGTKELEAVPHIDRVDEAFITPERLGPHTARMVALKHHPADVYLSLDDDMFFLPQSTFGAMVEKAQEPGVGLIAASNSTNVAQANRYMPDLFQPVFHSRKLVCTGGGLIFNRDIATLIRLLPDEQYLFDDVEWSLAAYLAGYLNLRYYGSWAIHKAGRLGGRNGWFQQRSKVLPNPKFIRLRKDASIKNPRLSEDNRVAFPTEADVTAEARQQHTFNRKARGWAL